MKGKVDAVVTLSYAVSMKPFYYALSGADETDKLTDSVANGDGGEGLWSRAIEEPVL